MASAGSHESKGLDPQSLRHVVDAVLGSARESAERPPGGLNGMLITVPSNVPIAAAAA
jgi:hypothetical protein